MIDFGTVKPGTTLYIPFATYDSNDPTASVTMTGLAVTDIEIYKDGSVTQRASDAGYTLLDTDGTDFDTITGIHGISIDLADNTTAGFYAAGSQYWVVLSSVTVDAGTISGILATFRIGLPDAVLNTTIATLASQTSFTLTSGPAENDALNGCVCYIHDVASSVQGGYAVISDYVGSTKTVTLASGATFTAAATDNISIFPPSNVHAWNSVPLLTTNPLPNAAADAAGGLPISDAGGLDLDAMNTAAVRLTAARAQIIDDWANGGRLDLLLDAIKVVTDGQGATGTGLTAIPWNAAWDAEVQSEANDALVAFFTSAAALVDLVWDEPIAGHLTAGTAGLSEALGSAALVDSTVTGTPTTTTFDFTGGSTSNNFYKDQLVYILSGTGIGQVRPILSSSYSGGTTTITVDEAWIVTPAASDRFAVLVSHVHPKSQITADIDANSTQLAAIVADTNELQGDWTNGGRLDLIIDELTTQGDTNEAKIDIIDANVDAVLADTADMQPKLGTPAGASISADIAAVKSDTAAILIDTNELQGDWTNGGRLDLIIDAILDDTGTSGVVLTAAERNSIADAILDRDMSTGTDSGSPSVRTVRQALRSNRNKVAISGGTMTVYKEDDTTASWTATIATTAGDPISSVDPA